MQIESFSFYLVFFLPRFPMFFNFSNAELLSYIVYVAIFSGFIGVSVMLYKIPDNRVSRKNIQLKMFLII